MSKKWIATAVVLLLLIIGVKVVLTLNGPSDVQLVRQALAEAIKASKEGRPGGVMDYLSENLKLNDQSPARSQIADFIKRSRPDISVDNTEPAIREGEGTAQMNSAVHVKLSFPGSSGVDEVIPNVTLRFQREDSREWLVIPTKQWRLVEVSAPPESIAPIMAKFSGFAGL